MSRDYAHGFHADANRRLKAIQLARLFYATPGPWPTEAKDRRAAERVAGVRPCSDETWALAASILAERQAYDARHGLVPS